MTTTKRNVYLVKIYENELMGSRLPSNGQVIGRFLHFHQKMKKTIRESAAKVINEVNGFWLKAHIPVKAPQHSTKKVEKLFEEWKSLKSHRKRTTAGHKEKEQTFVNNLEDLFDIAHADALTTMRVQEDIEFLHAQREKGRRGCMGPLDKVFVKKEGRVNRRRNRDYNRLKKREAKKEASTSQVVLTSSSSSTSASEDSDNDIIPGAVEGTPPSSHPKRARTNMISPGLAAALDRTKVSSRSATFILTEAARSFGHNVAEFNINHMSIHRRREEHRAQVYIIYRKSSREMTQMRHLLSTGMES